MCDIPAPETAVKTQPTRPTVALLTADSIFYSGELSDPADFTYDRRKGIP
jgi:hypothetical protein